MEEESVAPWDDPDDLQIGLRQTSGHDKGPLQLCGLLLARPETTFVRNEILEHLDYFHTRSERTMFYCAGYSLAPPTSNSPIVARAGNTAWTYSNVRFVAVIKSLEQRTRWRFSGGTDLVLANVLTAPTEGDGVPIIDISTAVAWNLERLVREEAIGSVRELLEQVFRYASSFKGDDPAWGISDSFAASGIKSALGRLVVSFLPEPLRKDAERLRHFAVEDFALPA